MTRVHSFLIALGLAAATALPAFAQQAPPFELVSLGDIGLKSGAIVAKVPRAAGGSWYLARLSTETIGRVFEGAMVCQVGTVSVTGPPVQVSVSPGLLTLAPFIAQELPGEPSDCFVQDMNDRQPADSAMLDTPGVIRVSVGRQDDDTGLVISATNDDSVAHDVSIRVIAWNDQKEYAIGIGSLTDLAADETRVFDLAVDGDMSGITTLQFVLDQRTLAGSHDRLSDLATRLEQQGALLLTNADGTPMVAAAYTNPTDTERNLEVAGLFAGPPAELTPRVRVGEAMPHQRRVLRLPLDQAMQALGGLSFAEHAWTSVPTKPKAAVAAQIALGKPVLFMGSDGTPWVDVSVTNNNADAMYALVQVNYWRGASLRATGMGRTLTMTKGRPLTARFPLRGLTLDAGDTPEVVIESLCSCAEQAAAH